MFAIPVGGQFPWSEWHVQESGVIARLVHWSPVTWLVVMPQRGAHPWQWSLCRPSGVTQSGVEKTEWGAMLMANRYWEQLMAASQEKGA